MRKKTIGIFYCVGLFLWVVSLILFIQLVAAGHSQLNMSKLMVEIVIGWIGGILIVIALMGALINSAKAGRWGWFVCLLLLSFFSIAAYLFTGPVPTSNAGSSSSSYK